MGKKLRTDFAPLGMTAKSRRPAKKRRSALLNATIGCGVGGEGQPIGIRPILRWDPEKAHSNARKHGVTFMEAASVFRDVLSITIRDPVHSTEEDRYITIGRSDRGRTLVVVHSDLGETIRVISARRATRRERREYEQGTP